MLILTFSVAQPMQLEFTEFTHHLLPEVLRCVRGKTSGAYQGCGTFHWSNAVRALTMLLAAAAQRLPEDHRPDLVGKKGSYAASLDYALDKVPFWVTDMFGSDSAGNPLIRRALLRSNPGLRRGDEVALSLNRAFLNTNQIEFRQGNQVIEARLLLDELLGTSTSQCSESRIYAVR